MQFIVGIIFGIITYFVFKIMIEKFNYITPGREADDEDVKLINKKEYKQKFQEKFGETMTRDELIQYIEDNNLEEELDKRVEEKWESFEESLKSNRKKKYGTQPVSEE